MDIGLFMDILGKNSVTFFSGVPDSLLSAFCDDLSRRFGINGQNHVVAHNEGGCVALASGYHLVTGKVPCVYMQNSGIGNALNPAASLIHPKVYGIPMLFVIGWRGEPGTKDEPQHIFQGEITLKLLDDMDIEYFIVDKATSAEQIEKVFVHFSELFAKGKSAAFVVRKGAFSGSEHEYKNNYSLNREQAIKIAVEAAGEDPIVSTTGKISRELFEMRKQRGEVHEKDFLTVGSMGHSVMIALGIALQQPERRVWCVDGDGAALMHMGSLSIVGSQDPPKFIHLLLNNSAHESVGGMPTAAGNVDFPSVALACEYRHAYRATDEKTFKEALERAKKQNGSVFVEALVSLGSRSDLGRPDKSAQENKHGFMSFLGATGESG